MIRVVLDTNILISALLTPHGLPAEILSLCLTDPDVQLAVSADVYAEYEEVIRRPRFKWSEDEIDAILRAIRVEAVWIKPKATVRLCLDPDDDIFFECASTAHAQFLVTGNIKHFPSVGEQTEIVTARQFMDIFA